MKTESDKSVQSESSSLIIVSSDYYAFSTASKSFVV